MSGNPLDQGHGSELPRRFFMDPRRSFPEGLFFMVAAGEVYSSRIVRGEDLVAALAGALYSSPDDMPEDEVKRWADSLENPDDWWTRDGVLLTWETKLEGDSVSFYRMSGDQEGADMIAAERSRQQLQEGFDHEHDDKHIFGEIAHAGSAYAETAALQSQYNSVPPCFIPKWWPWERKWWKPSPNPVRNLVRAGALIAAEIDRLQRAKRRPK